MKKIVVISVLALVAHDAMCGKLSSFKNNASKKLGEIRDRFNKSYGDFKKQHKERVEEIIKNKQSYKDAKELRNATIQKNQTEGKDTKLSEYTPVEHYRYKMSRSGRAALDARVTAELAGREIASGLRSAKTAISNRLPSWKRKKKQQMFL